MRLGFLSKSFANKFGRINLAPIVILGNQKSGTSVVAHLLAEIGKLSKTVDIPEIWGPTLQAITSGNLSLKDFAKSHRKYFSSELIKEPNLTFFYNQLKEIHPKAQFVFIIRDPRENVRSLLNRINLPGDKKTIILKEFDIPKNWLPLFDTSLLSLEGEQYIEILASRWNRAADVFLESNEIHLILYEDFLNDKVGTIQKLAKQLGVEFKKSIADKVDIQYQPMGNKSISWNEFFGIENLGRIERICGSRMKQFGYQPSLEAPIA